MGKKWDAIKNFVWEQVLDKWVLGSISVVLPSAFYLQEVLRDNFLCLLPLLPLSLALFYSLKVHGRKKPDGEIPEEIPEEIKTGCTLSKAEKEIYDICRDKEKRERFKITFWNTQEKVRFSDMRALKSKLEQCKKQAAEQSEKIFADCVGKLDPNDAKNAVYVSETKEDEDAIKNMRIMEFLSDPDLNCYLLNSLVGSPKAFKNLNLPKTSKVIFICSEKTEQSTFKSRIDSLCKGSYSILVLHPESHKPMVGNQHLKFITTKPYDSNSNVKQIISDFIYQK